jgi:hypothetical protein
LDEIGSEDDLFSTFMDMDKIADANRDRAAETSSPSRPAKHRYTAFFDGSAWMASVPARTCCGSHVRESRKEREHEEKRAKKAIEASTSREAIQVCMRRRPALCLSPTRKG